MKCSKITRQIHKSYSIGSANIYGLNVLDRVRLVEPQHLHRHYVHHGDVPTPPTTQNACFLHGCGVIIAGCTSVYSVYLPACLLAIALVGWFVHINCRRVCLSASDHSVYVENITRRHGPRIDRTPAGDASGQESTLLTVPSNAPYITYTDADGQVYRRRRRMSLPR